MKMRSIESPRRAFVPLDQPAEPFVAGDLIEHDRLVFRRRIGAGGRQEISRGVCPVVVVIADVFTDEMVAVPISMGINNARNDSAECIRPDDH